MVSIGNKAKCLLSINHFTKTIHHHHKSQETVIKLFNDYCKIVSEVKYKTKYGERLKILISKQILQRLPIAIAQVKAGNTSENLLNEIRQIMYSLYRQGCHHSLNVLKYP